MFRKSIKRNADFFKGIITWVIGILKVSQSNLNYLQRVVVS